jgi:hypothetical protein
MSVSIYNRSGGASIGAPSLKGVHSLIELGKDEVTSQCTESSALTNLGMSIDVVWTAPYIPNQSFTANGLFIFCSTAGGVGELARIMVYSDVSGYPDTLLGSTNSLGIATTGKKGDKFALDFVAGTTYWLAVQTNSNTAILSAIPITSLLCIQNRSDGAPYSTYVGTGVYASGAQTSFSSYTALGYSGGSMPFVGISKGA